MGESKQSSAVLLIYITIALLLLFILSFTPSRPARPNRRLKLRSNFTFTTSPPSTHQFPFDPIIADIERRREDREWERSHLSATEDHAPAMESQPEWEEFMDAEDYINTVDRFNVTQRVEILFPKIDLDPIDGYITLDELTAWNLAQARSDVLHRSKRDLELHDKNGDGFVSFDEYEQPSWSWRNEDNSTNDGMGWWKEAHFNASDSDGDGLLNLTEFNDFLHPADSTNPKVIEWLCKEEIRERDKDKDGKLSFQEYFNGLFYLIRNYDEHDATSSYDSETFGESAAKKLFSQIELDHDGYLSAEEIKPVIGNLHPSEHFYAKQQANYLLSQADSDKDERLSLREMIENPYVFYSAIFTEDDYQFHDEFR